MSVERGSAALAPAAAPPWLEAEMGMRGLAHARTHMYAVVLDGGCEGERAAGERGRGHRVVVGGSVLESCGRSRSGMRLGGRRSGLRRGWSGGRFLGVVGGGRG